MKSTLKILKYFLVVCFLFIKNTAETRRHGPHSPTAAPHTAIIFFQDFGKKTHTHIKDLSLEQ